ncbi:uncharacterized protein LOC112569454 [Pomacea canaliculata]|uniref:uncharacterized protein LOC112569454 n=1 Tax=Pomacea canaliculata TaxID=400727 RepID=UPI000D7344A9|nr:uncharacterized protein LOC112569454 [Pomacea canaliculata]
MDVSDRRTIKRMLVCCVWTSCSFLLLTGAWMIEGVKFEQCGADGIVEIVAGQNTSLTCNAEGTVMWRLIWLHNQTLHIANCTEGVCGNTILGDFNKLFQVQARGANDSIITINTEKLTKLYDRGVSINSSLVCSLMSAKHTVTTAARCELNYVHPPEEVSCEADYTLGFVNVSCVIGKVYSSRRIYKCRLFQRKNESSASLQTVEMETSPTSEKTIKSEVKVSGSCQFNTTLPPEEGCYDLFVSVSPTGRNYSVNFTSDGCYSTTDQPSISSQQPVIESVEAASVIVPASVSGLIVLIFVLIIVGHVIRKKRIGCWRTKNHIKKHEDSIDSGVKMQHHYALGSEQERKGNKQNLPALQNYEDPRDLVSFRTKLTMAEMNDKDVRLQEDESQLYDVLDYTKQKSRGNGRQNQVWRIEKNKEKKQDPKRFENCEYVTLGQLPWKRQAASCTQAAASSETSCARVQNVTDRMEIPGSPSVHSSRGHARAAARADDKIEYSLATSFPPDPLPPPQ